MKMGENCRSWEEEIYWRHFQCLHFSQFLHPGFGQQAIPEKFTKNLRNKLPKIATLKGPSGRTWEVELASNDDIMYFSHGWEEFVNDHLLQENDLLIFKYNVDSCFDVLIFDGQSLCEKVASYFVKKCCHRDQENGCQRERKVGQIAVGTTAPFPENLVQGLTPQKSTNNDIDSTPLRKAKPIAHPGAIKKMRRKIEWISNSHEEPPSSVEEVHSEPDIEPFGTSEVHDIPCISSRRLITEEEKQNALQLAQAALTRDGFMVVMKPTHVYRRFYMSIPSGWMAKHLSCLERQNVILRVKDNHWVTKLFYQKSRHSGGLSGGWKKFALANDLQEFDVCVFQLSGQLENGIVLDVNIIRAYQEYEP